MSEEIRTSDRIQNVWPIQTLIAEFSLTSCESMLFPTNFHVLLTTKSVIIERPEHINWCLAHKMETWSIQLLQHSLCINSSKLDDRWSAEHCFTLCSTREQSHTQKGKRSQGPEQTLALKQEVITAVRLALRSFTLQNEWAYARKVFVHVDYEQGFLLENWKWLKRTHSSS